MTQEYLEQLKSALKKCEKENENRRTYTFEVVVSSVCRSAREAIEELGKELENERKINEEIKARFVKCNTCTQEMKDKCLMFTENLCEGERCEELVDIMSLVEKRESDDKLKLAKDIIKRLLGNAPDTYSGTNIELQQSKMFAFQAASVDAYDFLGDSK